MQFELRTQVIEPKRKTFSHLIARYGDKPATRYQEGTVDLQPKVNFHFRPLWAPDKEIYDEAFSELRLTDPYSFTDPRQFYYAPYVTSRADLHEPFGSTLSYLEKRGMFDRLPEGWHGLFQNLVLPLRHYEAAAQMIAAHATRFGFGTSITQCFGYSSFDRIGNAQILSRVGIAFGGGTAEPLDLAKRVWLEDDTFQPLRKHVEEMLVEMDWGRAMVALDATDRLIYELLYTHLDDAAVSAGAGSYSLVAQHLSGWFTDQRKWFDALYKAWATDPEHGPANSAVIGEVVRTTLDTAVAALTPIAAKADELVGAGGSAAVDSLAVAAEQMRPTLAGVGVEIQ